MSRYVIILICLIGTSFFLFGIFYGDKGWYEEDALYMLDGSINFEARGPNGVYRYYLQPLTYEVLHFLSSLFGNGNRLYMIPAAAGAVALSLLMSALYYFSGGRVYLVFILCALIIFPELFFNLLYINASVWGMLWWGLALLLLWYVRSRPEWQWKGPVYFFIGGCAILACFFRYDFLLGLPLLLYLTGYPPGGKKEVFSCSAGIGVGILLGSITGIFNPARLYRVIAVHSELVYGNVHSYGWSFQRSLAVFSTLTSPLVWLAVSVVGIWYCIIAFRRREWRRLGIVIPSTILLYPLTQLTSPRYMIPLVCFLPFVVVGGLQQFRRRISRRGYRAVVIIFVGVSVALQFVTFEFIGFHDWGFPGVEVSTNPRRVSTHDGPRVSGAFIRGYEAVRAARYSRVSRPAIGHAIANGVISSNRDVVVAIPDTRPSYCNNLCHIPLFLQLEGYNRSGKGTRLELTGERNRVTIRRLPEKEYAALGSAPEKVMVKLPYISFSEDKTPPMRRLRENIEEVFDSSGDGGKSRETMNRPHAYSRAME